MALYSKHSFVCLRRHPFLRMVADGDSLRWYFVGIVVSFVAIVAPQVLFFQVSLLVASLVEEASAPALASSSRVGVVAMFLFASLCM